MSRLNTNQLSNEKIQQLLATVGMRASEDAGSAGDVQEYDWRRPRYFKLEQIQQIEAFAETTAGELLEEMKRLYRADCAVSMVTAQQSYPDESESEEQDVNYYQAFGEDSQRTFGLIIIPKSSALFWTGQILGDTAFDKEADRMLSKLEESLLSDIASGLIKAFTGAWSREIYPIGMPGMDRSLFEMDGSDELFEIVYEMKSESSEMPARITFLICCDKLESIAGTVSRRQEKLSETQIRNAVLGHIHHVPVAVHVELGEIKLAFKDVINLEIDDVVVLEKKVTDPVDVVVEDRRLFHGQPAQSGGHHAVVIV